MYGACITQHLEDMGNFEQMGYGRFYKYSTGACKGARLPPDPFGLAIWRSTTICEILSAL